MFAKTFTAEIITINGATIPAYTITAPSHKKAAAAMVLLMEDAPAHALANVAAVKVTDAKGTDYLWNITATK